MKDMMVVEVEGLIGVYELVEVIEDVVLKVKNTVRGIKFRLKNKARRAAFRAFVFINNNPILIPLFHILRGAVVGYILGWLIGQSILFLLILCI